MTAAANHSSPGVLALPDVDVGLEDLEDLGALGEGEEVLVLGQRGQQPQDEDLADLGGEGEDVEVPDDVQLHLRPAAVAVPSCRPAVAVL